MTAFAASIIFALMLIFPIIIAINFTGKEED